MEKPTYAQLIERKQIDLDWTLRQIDRENDHVTRATLRNDASDLELEIEGLKEAMQKEADDMAEAALEAQQRFPRTTRHVNIHD